MSSICRILIFLTFLACAIPSFGQQEDPRKVAQEYFDLAVSTLESTQALDQARDLYTLAAETDTTFVRANFEAGHIRIITIEKDLASKYFMRVYRQDPDFRFDIEFWIARSYQFGLNFDQAIGYYNKYKQRLAKKPDYRGRDRVELAQVDRHIKECETGKIMVANPQNVSITNIGREINSDYDDFGPVISEREDEIVFTSRRKDDNVNQNVSDDNLPYEDMYVAKKSGGKWDFARNMGEKINTAYHESSLAMSADGNTLFIYIDTNGGDIYYCERQGDGTWGNPIALPGIINSSFQEKSISISKDEKTLYFTSDRPGGFGGTDIYSATKDSKGHWTSVKNLGPKINTPLQDDGPFIGYDNVTFYFSSQGHEGMGGYDIYQSTYDPVSKEFSDPRNMGYPINTPDNEVYFLTSADSKRAYYSSVRQDGMGYTDIYIITSSTSLKDPEPVEPVTPVVTLPKKDSVKTEVVKTDPVKPDPIKPDPVKPDTVKKQPVKQPVKQPEIKKPIQPLIYVVKVVDGKTKTPLDAKIKMHGSKDNILVGLTPQGNGVYEFKITNTSPKDYKLSIESDGYVFQNQNLRIEGATTESKTLNRTIEMQKLVVNVSSVLRNIYYDYDKATFKTESYPELNKLETMLRANANLKIEVSGHTDAYGRWDYNRNLSQRRAEAVKDYLTKKGIDARRVKAVGYGESKPLASNDDEEEGRAINRRVEFKVLQN